MLKITAIGNLTNDVELKVNETTGKPYAILRIASDRRYKDKDGNMITTHGGGTSRKRMHAAKDYSGSEIMRTIRDEVINLGIPVVEFTSAVELLKDEKGQVAGAVLLNMETGDYSVARAKTVVIATGGAGRMHYQGFPTSNHYGATADGLVLAYRAGARLLYQDTLQYHPTGVAFPSQIYGALVTEKVRSMGAQFVNVNGEAFMHPLETRDVAASGVIREVARGNGIHTPLRDGIWLDSPMIDAIHGEGTLEKRLPGMLRMYLRYDIDMRKVPIVIYPTLHYQNGGVRVSVNGMSDVENLYVAGEAAGGVHGRNRLMGNSLLDVIVFGRDAGKAAAAKAKELYPSLPIEGELQFDAVAPEVTDVSEVIEIWKTLDIFQGVYFTGYTQNQAQDGYTVKVVCILSEHAGRQAADEN